MALHNPIVRLVFITGLILLIPALGNLFVDGWYWGIADFVIMGVAIFGAGLAYQLIAKRMGTTGVYRAAFATGLLGALLLFWVNGAVGIIGSDDNPANLLYGVIFLVGFVGSLASRFRAPGMARTLFVAAVVQFFIPIFALLVWPAKASWGELGVMGVLMFNFIFVLLFTLAGLLFRRATTP